MLIDKAGISRLIPHAGAMCLLEGVLSWDNARISCITVSHRAWNNPLRRNGRLGILCGIEYAAQAMALHGALATGGAERGVAARARLLGSVREVLCHIDRLDLLPEPLSVEAELLHGQAERAIYRFALSAGNRLLLDGRAAVAPAEVAP